MKLKLTKKVKRHSRKKEKFFLGGRTSGDYWMRREGVVGDDPCYNFDGLVRVQFFRDKNKEYQMIWWVHGINGWVPTTGIYAGELPINAPINESPRQIDSVSEKK